MVLSSDWLVDGELGDCLEYQDINCDSGIEKEFFFFGNVEFLINYGMG
jgi:hypothetical protein